MTYTLEYTIDKPAILEKAKAEVSEVADLAYADDGTSLYDIVAITSKDTDNISRLTDDAASALVSVMHDMCVDQPEVEPDDQDEPQETGRMQLLFTAPDMDPTQERMAIDEITRYFALYISVALFRERRPAVLPEYEERLKTAADNVIVRLRTRKKPSRQ